MRVLSLSNTPLDPTLGSGKTVLRWTEGLRARGHECLVLGRDQFTRPPWSRLPGRRFWMALAAWREAFRQVRRFAPDLVEFYGGEFGLAARGLRRRRSRPFLVAHTNGLELLAAHSMSSPHRSVVNRLHRRLDLAAFTHVDGFVAICDLDREYLVKRGLLKPEQTAVIEPGLDEEYLQRADVPLNPREHVVAFTGSWVARKDPSVIVEVMSRLLREDAQLRFRVFGSGWAEAQIRAAFPPEVQGRIDVAPKLSNDALADALARCKIFFFPSRYEGYGMAVAEAMACGCAAVTTPTGLGGSLRDGIDARICAVGDAVAFATALRALLQNDAQREALAGQGRKRAAAFNWQRQCAELDSLYTGWVRARSTEPVSQ